MKTETIINAAASVLDAYGPEPDPSEICRKTGIVLLYESMGSSPDACKGFIISDSGCTAICINSDLHPRIQLLVLWHELGHYFLHINPDGKGDFQDFSVSDCSRAAEYEANMFAAELMISDERLSGISDSENDFFSVAAILNVPAEMLDFKFRSYRLRHPGSTSVPVPIDTTGDFLARFDSPVPH